MSQFFRRNFEARWRPVLHRLDCFRFSFVRADYFDYLSALLDGLQGRRTLKEVFEQDARRYGSASVRGRLSRRWVQGYQLAGGDLYATWSGCFPQIELGLIRTAQSFGNAALIKTFRELAHVLNLTQKTTEILVTTLWAAVMAVFLVFGMMLAIPWFTVPQLTRTFSAVPTEYYGTLTRSLIDFSGLIQAHYLFMAVLLVGGCMLLLWSLPNSSGPIRRRLENFALWRIYRYVAALRFLALVAIVLGRDDSESTQLRTALVLQKTATSKWQLSHINAMLARIDAGMAGADTFDTGLLDREQFWFFSDMVMARGLQTGLMLGSERLRGHVLGTVARQATALRWSLLLASLACLLGVGVWHYAVIDELRRSLMLFYASQ
ncbi:general secretion pathway protein [Candidimonas sp. SYP-B2681]|uniref:general secretion pathway protein n=1 Tax=Candidimonas sp. SYP-B2681 TaxID=2497686 RepID=UPI000F865960|nr:general secretion pathway protein [Candidimonas sp. SYP-B2681]RTZ41053.1 general secretion pathway protein [Candidimonas sp. SYP-B2681]